MSTTPAPTEKPELTDLARTEPDGQPTAVRALAEAQEEIAGLKDRMLEERMAWIVVFVIVFDCFLFLDAENWSGPLIIGLLELAALSVIASRLGVEEFAALFKGALNRVTSFVDKE